MDLIKLLDVANPKKTRDTINLLILNYEGFRDEILAIAEEADAKADAAQLSAESAQTSATTAQTLAEQAQSSANAAEVSAEQANVSASAAASSADAANTTANTALSTAESANNAATQAVTIANAAVESAAQANATADNAVTTANAATQDAEDALAASATAVQTADAAEDTATLAESTAAEALGIANTAASDAVEAIETSETALQNANDATETSELAMQIATEAKSTIDQAVSTGVFGTFVHNATGMSLLHAYMTNSLNQEDTDSNFYMATPKLVRDALANYYDKSIIDELETELTNAAQDLASGKVDKVEGKGLSTEDYTTEEKTKLSNAVISTALQDYRYSVTGDGYWTVAANGKLNTNGGSVTNVYKPLQGATSDFGTITRATSMSSIINAHNSLVDTVANKVDQVSGKELSTNDFTDAYKEMLDNMTAYDDTELRELIATETTNRTTADEAINIALANKMDTTVTEVYTAHTDDPDITSTFTRRGHGFSLDVDYVGSTFTNHFNYGVNNQGTSVSLGEIGLIRRYKNASTIYINRLSPFSLTLEQYNSSDIYPYRVVLDSYGGFIDLTYTGTNTSVEAHTVHHMTREGYFINEDSVRGNSGQFSGTGFDKTGVLIQDKRLEPNTDGDLLWDNTKLAYASDIPEIPDVPTNYMTTDTVQTVAVNKTFSGSITINELHATTIYLD